MAEERVGGTPGWSAVAVSVVVAVVFGVGALWLDHVNDQNRSDPVEALLGVSIFVALVAAGGALALATQRVGSRQK